MVRYTDQETAIRKIVGDSVCRSRGRAVPCGDKDTQGSTRSLRRQWEHRRAVGKTLYCGFCGKERQNK